MADHFAARRLVPALCLLLLSFAATPLLRAEDEAAAPDSENAKRQFIGQINAANVLVRSGPNENAYATMRLDKGTKVTVIGIKFNWLKILPPDGSFAYVSKVFVQRFGDGSKGKATRQLWAKTGSRLVDLKIAQMASVDEGQEVQIIGDKDEYFEIKPPAGSAVWVNKQFVDPVRVVADAPPEKPDVTHPVNKPDAPPVADPKPGVDELAQGGATTQPATTQAAGATTQSSDAVAQASDQFDQAETAYAAAGQKPVLEQPLAELQAQYDAVLKQDALPDSMRRIAQVRAATLKIRTEAKQEYVAFKEQQEKSNERRKALAAEQEEIQERLKKNSVTIYAAVGTLRTSSIQHAGATLYRLTDPETGRTVAYLRTTDGGPVALLGQFVGVKGTVNSDAALGLKIIENPTTVEAVDQTKVNGSVAAQILPPSLIPRSTQASTVGE